LIIVPEELIAPESVMTPEESALRESDPVPLIALEIESAEVAVERTVLPAAGMLMLPEGKVHAEELLE
jgi:hypothetical protein